MPKRITTEQRIEEHIATASREELSSLIRAATLVIRAKYPETQPAKPPAKRVARAKKEAAGIGFVEYNSGLAAGAARSSP